MTFYQLFLSVFFYSQSPPPPNPVLALFLSESFFTVKHYQPCRFNCDSLQDQPAPRFSFLLASTGWLNVSPNSHVGTSVLPCLPPADAWSCGWIVSASFSTSPLPSTQSLVRPSPHCCSLPSWLPSTRTHCVIYLFKVWLKIPQLYPHHHALQNSISFKWDYRVGFCFVFPFGVRC